ncbi:unnamed protein product [Blepharisma stoltei]|uniref:Uncharacterized protein n=1 Tax=Blepharisma stoltei TaxID=1481888 RepID=A0AAU9JPQ5_9CILI|nr:unnamed protein product [Blepharisma stoltei]
MGCTGSIGKVKIIRNKSDKLTEKNKKTENLIQILGNCEKATEFIKVEKNLFKISEVDPDLEESGMISISYHKISTNCLSTEKIKRTLYIKASSQLFNRNQKVMSLLKRSYQ